MALVLEHRSDDGRLIAVGRIKNGITSMIGMDLILTLEQAMELARASACNSQGIILSAERRSWTLRIRTDR